MMKRFRKSIDFVTKILLKILEISIYKLNKLRTNLLWSILLMLNKIKRKKFSGKFKDFKIIMMTRLWKSIVFVIKTLLKILKNHYKLNKLMTNLLWSILLMLNKIRRKKLSEWYQDFKLIMMKKFQKSIVFVIKILLNYFQKSMNKLNKLITNLLLSIPLMINKIKREEVRII